MKVIAINGSPRKTWNTATLLNEALKGAESKGAKTEIIHLYDLNFKGCTSCFSCKLKNSKSYGHCGYQDELKPVLDMIPEVDALIIGSPIYIGMLTGEMKKFLERLAFPYVAYDKARSFRFPKKMPVGLIFTTGAPEEYLQAAGTNQNISQTENLLKRFGPVELLLSTDTYQFDDYSKYQQEFDVKAKAERREKVFPLDCKKAFDLGIQLVS
ncbi:MAG TPA: flavodoxin family protein [Candidatus Limnocylindrales bacterium]|nr:flavodoxin family protein [Candidatus Limnocylindrales bacterium]